MSQTPLKAKHAVLKIRNRNPGTISHGANTIVELDGKKLPMVSFVKLEFHAKRVTKVTLEMYCDVETEIEPGDVDLTIKKVSGWRSVLGELQKVFFK